MNQEDNKQLQDESQIRVIKLNLFEQDNKSYLIYGDSLKSLFIKIKNNKMQMESLPLIDFATTKYNDRFIKATKVELINGEMYIFYDLRNHFFLDFSASFLDNLTPSTSLIIFKNYMKILFSLLLLNEDFSEFDSKLFYFYKCPRSGGVVIRYLYHGKLFNF